ncbi:hypothetical protein ZIOFF_028099 [Zingiber officinale]|uniref:ESCRT-II complex subunit VPS25 n=1 Tax=Zingiber officinale TaxID=94328 RepID=A0A8J5GUH0_ZINOF|nr:hypothetical protein ZIOFF_028099 [Zingiber officinale]
MRILGLRRREEGGEEEEDNERKYTYENRQSMAPSPEDFGKGSLSHEAREVFLSALVNEGRAEWMDKGHKKCLLLWLRIQEWADYILNFVKENGFEDSVMTIEEIRSGIETRGTELAGIDRGLLVRALKLLEQKGKVAIFKGTSTDDDGVKFSA